MQLRQLIDGVQRIRSDSDLAKFLQAFRFSKEGLDQSPTPQTYLVAEVETDEGRARLHHRWVDPSGPFQNLPDLAKVELFVNGSKLATAEYQDS